MELTRALEISVRRLQSERPQLLERARRAAREQDTWPRTVPDAPAGGPTDKPVSPPGHARSLRASLALVSEAIALLGEDGA